MPTLAAKPKTRCPEGAQVGPPKLYPFKSNDYRAGW
jgi:hypothetical protein